jgi:hypothetical protein
MGVMGVMEVADLDIVMVMSMVKANGLRATQQVGAGQFQRSLAG